MGKALPEIKLVRAYDVGDQDVGCRLLVDRLWPRGLSKEKLQLDEWLKDLAPSTELRKWFGHRPERWAEFRKRYLAELKDRSDEVDRLLKLSARRRIALIYGARDELHNEAVVLKSLLESRRAKSARARSGRAASLSEARQ
jgi:uncharacterized protein YeaO (DUF488 family)